MDVHQMRVELLKFYGEPWRVKVRNMSDSQITAIFMKFKQEGKIK